MNPKLFKEDLLQTINNNIDILQINDKQQWTIKGFVDVFKNIYIVSADTKVISKVLKLMLFPIISAFAKDHNLKMELAEHQNHYPDITFTLGAFTGYFRDRKSTKNITYSYNQYDKHFVLGIIYSKQKKEINEKKVYTIDELDEILSVIHDFEFLVQEKYKIASDKPGSGNTKNIGSIKNIPNLKNGCGPFSKLGIEIFDDYWMYYLTKDMTEDDIVPYSNLKEYVEYKNISPNLDVIEDIDKYID